MAESLVGDEAPQLPKSAPLQQTKMVLEQLKAFCDVQPAYQRRGWQQLVELVDWVSHNQHVARRVD